MALGAGGAYLREGIGKTPKKALTTVLKYAMIHNEEVFSPKGVRQDMKYYVVADVHGYYTHLMRALTDAGFFSETEPCKLIVCGDLLDRGPEARELIEFMLQLLAEDRLIYVLGNHEELLVQCLQEISRGGVHRIASGMTPHTGNMTWDTLLQISEMIENDAYRFPNELVSRVSQSPLYQKLLRICVDYYETPRYIFVHGWIPCKEEGWKPYVTYTYDPEWRDGDEMQWRRARWVNGMEVGAKQCVTEAGKTIVCGHWHTSFGHSKIEGKGSEWGEDADFSPFSATGILAIDACAAVSGRINCVVIED